MLDLRYVRTHPDVVKDGARKKHVAVDVDRLLALDDEAVALRQQVEQLRAQLNETSRLVPRAGGEEKQRLIAAGRATSEQIKAAEPQLKELEEQVQQLLLKVPNPPAAD